MLLLVCVGLGLTACRARSAPPVGEPRFRSPRALDVLAGRVPIVAEGPASGAGRRVLLDGKPGPALDASGNGWLDTQPLADGLHQLQLAAAGPGSAAVSVVVLNHGAEVFFKDGSEGVIEAPTAPSGGHDEAQHYRFHWEMTAGAKAVLALLSWSGEGFDLEAAVGTGTCPHHGQRLAVGHSPESPVTILHRSPSGGDLSLEQWFVHARLLNGEAVLGRRAPFHVRAFLLR